MSRARELNYERTMLAHGSYEYHKITPREGTNNIPVGPNSTATNHIEIPPLVHNENRSFLNFTLTPAIAAGAGAAHYNNMFLDGIPCIQSIQLLTKSGLYLADITDANVYTNLIGRRETKLDEITCTSANVASGVGYIENGLVKNNGLINAVPSLRYAAAAAVNAATNYFEPRYVSIGADGTATPVLNYRINLGTYKNSLFALDKDVYFGGEILVLKIIWAPGSRVKYHTSVATGVNTNVSEDTSGYTISNLELMLAVETNPELERDARDKAMSMEGFQIVVPYVYTIKNNFGVGTTQNITTRLDAGHGRKLLKIYYAPYNNTEQSNTAYDHNCLSDGKIITFYTTINDRRTSQFNYDTSSYEDWLVQKEKLKGSCIFSEDEYYYNWCWVEDFTNNYRMYDKSALVDESNIIDGLTLTNQQIKYSIYSTCASAAYNHFFFVITQKLLVVSPNGIQLS